MYRAMLHQIFLVNAYPPKPLDIATANFAGAYDVEETVEETEQRFVFIIDLRSRSKVK